MSKIVLTPDAEIRLEKALAQYRQKILSTITLHDVDNVQNVSAEDVDYAIKCIDQQQAQHNYKTRKSTQLKNFLWALATFCIMLCLVAFSLLLINNDNLMSAKQIEEFITYISILTCLLSVIMALSISYRTSHRANKTNQIEEFLNKWRYFEKSLRLNYKGDKVHTPSFIDLMQYFLEDFDDNYPSKAKDFKTVLSVRNEIVHGDSIKNISNKDLANAIIILNKLIVDVNK